MCKHVKTHQISLGAGSPHAAQVSTMFAFARTKEKAGNATATHQIYMTRTLFAYSLN